ncbi:hypothetical protein GCM10007116_17290 [Sulfodiicoccus acidiphilus]|uniref:Uncharacterized protein n=1 Tax=Sulfodiicoccus acidiphilus TaxID=1670455 RepID=A0A830H2D0_9CREN|nr:hypothetical protein GCM10007116_17290 [Sulfodiicoccus acidiphilus]
MVQIVNLNTHILFAVSLGMVLTHHVELAVLIGIGAALPDLDREYVFTTRKLFSKFQLHRALLHNVFFVAGLYLINPWLALGAACHIGLDLLTSPTDRGVEPFFPLTRLVTGVYLTLEGEVVNRRGLSWYLEDPVTLVQETADPGLRESGVVPWLRVYGPFRNSRLMDWGVFYSSLVFVALYTQVRLDYGFLGWLLRFLGNAFLGHPLIVGGLVLFYLTGEVWRRKLQFSGSHRREVLASILVSVASLSIGIVSVRMGGVVDWSLVGMVSLALLIGMSIAYVHVRLRNGRVVL